MLLFDAHLDLAWNAIDWNRDLTLPLAEVRARELDLPGKGRGRGTVTLPEMRRGHVGICIATLLARLLRDTNPPLQRYQSMSSAWAAAKGQLAWYEAMAEQGHMSWIRTRTELANSTAAWQDPATAAPIGFILSMEGADPILAPRQVEAWWQSGLRIVGPAHYGVSPYAHGTGTEGGLFPSGPDLLREMRRVGMILDVTHLADQSFDEALDLWDGPVLASHHNCRTLVPNQRQLADEQIRRLIQRGAVIGMALDAWMLHPGWVRGATPPDVVGVEAVVNHVDHVCQLAGSARHVALGSDLDGGFGTEQTPRDVNSIADLQKIAVLLRQRGYPEPDVAGICSGNWLRFFGEALPQ